MNSNQPPALSPEIIDDLRNRYGEPEIPKCSICGGELSVQRAGGGSATIWACSGMIDDPTGQRSWIYAEGRSMADDHYERSRWTDFRRGGDSDVIDLINAYQALAVQPESQRYKLPDGFVAVPSELTAENGAKHALSGEFYVGHTVACPECVGEGYEDCGNKGQWEEAIMIDWPTIKEIWRRGIDHFENHVVEGE